MIKAKEVSKWSMIVSAVWIGALSLLKGFSTVLFSKPFDLTIKEIIFSGLALAVAFSPVYLSIVLDKIKDIKVGDITKPGA